MLRKANYNEMSKSLNRMNEIAENIKNELNEMQAKAHNLDIFWDGEANAKYILNFNAGMFSANLLLEKIRRCGSFLSYALSRYQTSEREINELIEKLCKP